MALSPSVLNGAPDLTASGALFFYSPRKYEASPGFDSITTDSQFSWVSQGRLNADPAMQFTGNGPETITIEGRLYPHMFGGIKTLDALRGLGRAGKPLQLSRFYVLKDPVQYVAELFPQKVSIIRLQKKEGKIGGVGIANTIDFTLELQAYGDDTAADFLFAEIAEAVKEAVTEEQAPQVGQEPRGDE